MSGFGDKPFTIYWRLADLDLLWYQLFASAHRVREPLIAPINNYIAWFHVLHLKRGHKERGFEGHLNSIQVSQSVVFKATRDKNAMYFVVLSDRGYQVGNGGINSRTSHHQNYYRTWFL